MLATARSARAFQGVMNQQLVVGNAGIRRAIRTVGAVAARRTLREEMLRAVGCARDRGR
jgi:hypothetical protein